MAERAIRITAGTVSAQATLNDSKTARAIWDALPIEAKAQTWGDEIYFAIGVDEAEEQARAVVELGDLGYWPPGHAFLDLRHVRGVEKDLHDDPLFSGSAR